MAKHRVLIDDAEVWSEPEIGGVGPVSQVFFTVTASDEANGSPLLFHVRVTGRFAEQCRKLRKGDHLDLEGTLIADDSGNCPAFFGAHGLPGAWFELEFSRFQPDRQAPKDKK